MIKFLLRAKTVFGCLVLFFLAAVGRPLYCKLDLSDGGCIYAKKASCDDSTPTCDESEGYETYTAAPGFCAEFEAIGCM